MSVERSNTTVMEVEPPSEQKAAQALEVQAKDQPCFHCGNPCREKGWSVQEKSFCCNGCLAVFELLTSSGLDHFYSLSEKAGVKIKPAGNSYEFLDAPEVRRKLADFENDKITRVTFRLPAIHCVACVWLLENLFRLKPGIGASQVNFPRKEATITIETSKVRLSEVATLLTSLGYPPELKLADLDNTPEPRISRKLWLQTGVAGFAFGNNMMFSIAIYLGLDAVNGPALKAMMGYLSLLLCIPVVVYSAQDYWRAAWASLKLRLLTIEVPIAVGILAIFTQSAWEVISGRGEGYFDSLAGLLFFLLIGKLFQQKTYSRLNFERDYRSFFPLSITRKSDHHTEPISLSQLRLGDRLLVRNGELIPADATLVSGPACVDYSFVTGESEPVEKAPGDYLYAGGRQIGGAIEIQTAKELSQSYLTSLWNQAVFRKDKHATLNSLINVFSQRFTRVVILIALGSALFWLWRNPALSLKAFVSVLIVACPCALALAAPFTLGTAMRALGRRNVYLKNTEVIEALARVDAVVFDKTGTLTAAGAGAIQFRGMPLTDEEERAVFSLTRHSTHPYAVRIGDSLCERHFAEQVRSFAEITGCGIEGSVRGLDLCLGSASWLECRGVKGPFESAPAGSVVHLAIDGRYRGAYLLLSAIRPQVREAVRDLNTTCELALLSGDNDKEAPRFRELFGEECNLRFNQSPLQKLQYVEELQNRGTTVMMLGDGLNDAGALKQSDVGVAVVENIGAFPPASDVIMTAGMIARTPSLLRFSKGAVRIVKLSFLISALYNVIGVSIAASGRLAPIVCAILMPLSSITVVAFACGATQWWARKVFKHGENR